VITALLAFYDEPVGFLRRAVHSCARIGVTRLVALDGAYQRLPDGQPSSPDEQLEAIWEAALQARMIPSIHVPGRLWETEMEKRTELFRLAEAGCNPSEDWYLVLDADFEVLSTVPDLPATLAHAGRDAALVMLQTTAGSLYPHLPPLTPFRAFYRAIPGLHVEGTHYTYQTPDGRKLWGHPDEIEPALDLTEQIRVVHHTNQRTPERALRQRAYYRARDRAGDEMLDCHRCGQPAIGYAPVHLREVSSHSVEADWERVCPTCLRRVRRENLVAAHRLGITPEAFLQQRLGEVASAPGLPLAV